MFDDDNCEKNVGSEENCVGVLVGGVLCARRKSVFSGVVKIFT